MEQMTCQLSPATLAALYEMLQGSQYADAMQGRADLLGEELGVLAELGRLYEEWWSYQCRYATGQPDLLQSTGPAHSQLATWFLSVLRGPSLDFSAELQRRTQEMLRAALSADQQETASEMRPTVIGWSLGNVPGNYDYSLPVLFAEEAPDANVRLAYMGLVEHLVRLGEEHPPWPEILATAVIWRCAGIAEGLMPKENLLATLQQLTAQIRPVLPSGQHRALDEHWGEFTQMRNALTHVAARVGDYGFGVRCPEASGQSIH